VLEEVAAVSLPEALDPNQAGVRQLYADRFEARGDLDTVPAGHNVYQMPEDALCGSELFLVTETEMAGPTLSRFTEKTLKAVIAGIPFVVFGNVNTIAALREVGFDPFDGVVDHRYDAIADPAERFEAAWAEAARLLDTGPGLVERHRARIDAANRHNAAVFRDRLPLQWIERPLRQVLRWASAPVAPDRAAG
jgi:hypothetical protein